MTDDVDEIEEQDVPDDGEDEEEKPPIEDEEFADLSAVADEIEESAGAGAEDEGDAGDDQDDADQEASSDDHTRGRPGRGWGDMYVASVTSGLNAVIDEHGKPGAEKLDEQMARDLHLDDAFEEVMEKRGRADMPPEQELLMGTLILAGTVVLSKTDLPAQALGEVSDDA